MDDSNNDEMTAQAVLESFIPKNFRKTNPPDQSSKSSNDQRNKTKRKLEKGEPSVPQFPRESKQQEEVREFIQKRSQTDLIMTIGQVLEILSVRMKKYQWPDDLLNTFLKAYLVWRDCFVLPNAMVNNFAIEYIDVMLLANEIIILKLKSQSEDDKTGSSSAVLPNMEDFVKPDFVHLRLSAYKLSRTQNIRLTYLQHQYNLETKEVRRLIA